VVFKKAQGFGKMYNLVSVSNQARDYSKQARHLITIKSI